MPSIDLNGSGSESDPRVAAAVDVARRLREAGYTAYFAGGCVRDWLRGLHPKDIDVVTNATPQEIRKVFPRARDVGEAFGVMLVRHQGHVFEIATFRSDGEYTDGRRPDTVILHGSPEEDAERRDFSINGMFLDPATGEVIDYVGGVADLQARRIRAIGDPAARFGEDQLRLMRAVRFAAQTGFEIESGTWDAICHLAPRLQSIARERVLDEMTRFLVGPRPDLGLQLAADTGLLHVAVPGVPADSVTHAVAMLALLRDDAEVVKPPDARDEDDAADEPGNDPWRLQREDGAHWPTPPLAWSCVLHAMAPPDALAMAEHTRMSNNHRDRVVALVEDREGGESIEHLGLLPPSTLKRNLRRRWIDEHVAHYRLHRLADPAAVGCCQFALRRLHEIEAAPDPLDRLWPPSLLDGHGLQRLGYKPGKQFKPMLHDLETATLEGELRTPDAAVQFIRERYPLKADPGK